MSITRRRTLKAALLGAVACVAAPAAHAETFVNVLTGGTSGVYYPMGVAVSTVIEENVPDVRTSVQSTKASVENLNLIDQGKGEIAFALGDSVKYAAEGNEEAGFRKPLDNLRAIGVIYPNVVQIVAGAESGIEILDDLKGKGLSVGAPKSGTELNARAILGAADMTYDDLGKVEYLPFAESVELMKNRQIDATLQSAGLGVASIRDLSTSIKIKVIPVEASLVEKLGSPYVVTTIPANTYDGQDEDVPAAAVPNYLVTSSEVDEELVYQMTKAIFENLDELVAAHQAAKAIDPAEAAKDTVIPLHPGAERYFKEAGLI